MVFPEPLNKASDPHFNGGGGLKPQPGLGPADIRAGGGHVPRLHGEEFLLGRDPQLLLQQGDDFG